MGTWIKFTAIQDKMLIFRLWTDVATSQCFWLFLEFCAKVAAATTGEAF